MSHHWGYVAAVTSAVLFGMGATLNKIVLADVDPTVTAGLIYFLAGITLVFVRFSPLRGHVVNSLKTPTKTEPKFCRRDFVILGLVIISGSILAPLLFLNGLNQTTAVNASLLQNTECLFTVLIAIVFLKEIANRKEWLAIGLVVLGAVLLATNANFQQVSLSQGVIGNVLILMACLFWAVDNSLSKLLCFKEDLILVTALKCLMGGSALLLLGYLLNLSFQIPLSAVPYLVTVGAFSIGFSILLFMVGLREIGSMRTGTIFSTASLFGAFFAFIVLQEPFTIIQFIAGLIMVSGVYFLYKK